MSCVLAETFSEDSAQPPILRPEQPGTSGIIALIHWQITYRYKPSRNRALIEIGERNGATIINTQPLPNSRLSRDHQGVPHPDHSNASDSNLPRFLPLGTKDFSPISVLIMIGNQTFRMRKDREWRGSLHTTPTNKALIASLVFMSGRLIPLPHFQFRPTPPEPSWNYTQTVYDPNLLGPETKFKRVRHHPNHNASGHSVHRLPNL